MSSVIPLRPTFTAIDFETANRYRNSACAVGLVRVDNGRVARRAQFLIRPPFKFFEFTSIHGISWTDVASSPTFAELWPTLDPFLSGIDFLAAHNASFDRSVLRACCKQSDIVDPDIEFRCTVKLARTTWGLRPTTLPHVATFLGIPLNHHNAGSDAYACARIVLKAMVAHLN